MQMKCSVCGNMYKSVYALSGHTNAHTGRNKGKTAWNKGKTKLTDARVAANSIAVGNSLRGIKKQPLTENTKLKLSYAMKKAHSEGRAWNIGKSRWNSERSYPEKFFSNVIANEFLDKNVVQELPLSIYSLDFAWPHKKKCIEIDGSQHERFAECILRDKRKDLAISDAGWQVLRIKWADLYHTPKTQIARAKRFIDS